MKKIIALIGMILAISMLFSFGASAASKISWKNADYDKPSDKYAYTFVAIGDQQVLAMLDSGKHVKEEGSMPAEFAGQNYLANMYQWIVDNKESKKIEYVFGLGDITEHISDTTEWQLAKTAVSKLNGVIPYSLTRGNHDSAAGFKNYIAVETYKNQFDAHYGSEYLNTCKKITICGVKYLMITLACDPTDMELGWAEKMVKENPDCRTIITTHSYVDNTGVPSSSITSLKIPNSNAGKAIWEKLVSKYENIFMVISGHVADEDGFKYTNKKGVNGNTVHQLLINPQDVDFTIEPTGMLTLLHFGNDGKSISVENYSTIKGRYATSGTSFKIDPTGTEIIQTTATTAATTVEDTTPVETTAETTEAVKSGCGGYVSVALVPMCVSLGIGVVASKKRSQK